jgi:hypothetical protein
MCSPSRPLLSIYKILKIQYSLQTGSLLHVLCQVLSLKKGWTIKINQIRVCYAPLPVWIKLGAVLLIRPGLKTTE